jgi:hypothetical protein
MKYDRKFKVTLSKKRFWALPCGYGLPVGWPYRLIAIIIKIFRWKARAVETVVAFTNTSLVPVLNSISDIQASCRESAIITFMITVSLPPSHILGHPAHKHALFTQQHPQFTSFISAAPNSWSSLPHERLDRTNVCLQGDRELQISQHIWFPVRHRERAPDSFYGTMCMW